MFRSPTFLIHWSRTLCQSFFHRFGLHCATHQIRIILVSCVVITSLFYPALAIYSSSQPKSLSILDTFTSRNANPSFDAQKDLVSLWSSHNTLKLHEDAVSRAKCGVGTALRVERVLIPSTHPDDDGAVNHQTLLSTLQFENRLEHLVSTGDTPCLKGPSGSCLVLSPLLFWSHDKETLASDINLLDVLSASRNTSVGSILVTPQMVLAGRGSNEPHVAGSGFDFARFLALTYFFPGSDCLGTSEHTSFLRSVERALAQDSKPVVQVQEPTLIALEYEPNLSKGERWSALSAFMYLPYLGFLVYVVWSVRNMSAVHSRLGVTFTALVEIAVSTITSLSVCALVGFKVTLVPWELLPIVIVFVGAENMFNLVDAVGKTSVTLSVKQRIAEGLSRAGTSNTLKVVLYNAILGVIAFFSVGAVRQFCAFAIVVLVAHWFLAHTFFMAVLSIDVQRLELSELLRHDTSLTPAVPKLLGDSTTKQPQSYWQKLVVIVKNLLKGRAATNLSLLMLLGITATLYYTTYSSSTFSSDQISSVSQLGAPSRLKTSVPDAELDKTSAAWNMWKTINPAQTPLLHLRIEEPIVVTLTSNIEQSPLNRSHKLSRPRFSTGTFWLILWLLKIMVLPIAATTSLLWGLLLYLLKNAELLEAGKLDLIDPTEDKQTLESQISFSTLPRAFSSDVELIAASKDGKVVVSVGLHNEIIIWRVETRSHVSIDAADVLLGTASTSSAVSTLTCVAVDDFGGYCAVGTGAGVIAVWALEEDRVRLLPTLSLDMLSARVTELRFCSPATEIGHSLLATYENGVAAKWCVEDVLTATYIKPSSRASVVRSSLVCVDPVDRYLIAFSLDDGTLELIDAQATDTPAVHPFIQPDYHVQAGHPTDLPSRVHACQTELAGSTQLVIAIATEDGRISLWDGLTSECISILDETYGRINSLRVTPVQCEICHFCGQLPLESISVAFSVDHVIRFFKLYLNDQTRRCACLQNTLHKVSSRDNVGRRSRSNSTNSQLVSRSPSLARARGARPSSAFPVSGHGVHSRRSSEKETGRRSLETLTIPVLGEGQESGGISPTADPLGGRTPTHSFASVWRDAVVVRVMDITCERGGWGVNGTKAVGVRRKPRTHIPHQALTALEIKPASSQGLTAATLERWEFWMFDTAASRLQSSLLTDLTKNARKPDLSSALSSRSRGSTDPIPRLPFTRVSPFLIASTHGLAGFGNTVGVFNFAST